VERLPCAYFVFQSAFMSQELKDDLQHIRKMMEQSSRFISLNGLSGVAAGIIALAGAWAAYYILQKNSIDYFQGYSEAPDTGVVTQLSLLAIVVLVAALGTGILLTVNKTKKQGHKVWTSTTKKLLVALFVPLIFGGLFCLAAMYHGYFIIMAPLMLVFYGLALINAGRYTFSDIQNLGYCEAFLGVIAMLVPGYGLVFWALGFGILHIVYGLLMYKKYR
jgi:predicted lysophospholipase L1 biosynthesis ABC-type transport system permease subunit